MPCNHMWMIFGGHHIELRDDFSFLYNTTGLYCSNILSHQRRELVMLLLSVLVN